MRGTAGSHGNDADRDTRFWLRPGCEVRQGGQQSSRSGWGWGQVETRSSYAKNCCFSSVAVPVRVGNVTRSNRLGIRHTAEMPGEIRRGAEQGNQEGQREIKEKSRGSGAMAALAGDSLSCRHSRPEEQGSLNLEGGTGQGQGNATGRGAGAEGRVRGWEQCPSLELSANWGSGNCRCHSPQSSRPYDVETTTLLCPQTDLFQLP